jgi:hypothetical protein
MSPPRCWINVNYLCTLEPFWLCNTSYMPDWGSLRWWPGGVYLPNILEIFASRHLRSAWEIYLGFRLVPIHELTSFGGKFFEFWKFWRVTGRRVLVGGYGRAGRRLRIFSEKMLTDPSHTRTHVPAYTRARITGTSRRVRVVPDEYKQISSVDWWNMYTPSFKRKYVDTVGLRNRGNTCQSPISKSAGVRANSVTVRKSA